jgi:Zn-dependent peptidase ImmA (M78 family)/transcriptional regulator with XRE-family HTH domain
MEKAVNPVMITLARESRGIPQWKLAEEIGVTQAMVSKLESGHLQPSPQVVSNLAKVLEYSEQFFYQPFQRYPAGAHFYRKHKTLPAKTATRIEATLNIYRFQVGQLLTAAETDFVDFPECDIDEYGSPTEVARAIRQYLRIPNGPVQSMTELLESLGIVVIPFDPGTRQFQGASMHAHKAKYVTLINSQMPGDRFRWTLAHEFGHMVMHRLPTPNMEAEANEFAAEFLMPSSEIKTELRNLYPEKLASLKLRWKVAMTAILRHALRLEMITERQYKTLIYRLAAEGITRTSEPPELYIPVEKASLISELIDFHLSDLGYSLAQLSDFLWIKVAEFRQRYRDSVPSLALLKAN